jgi:imidazoleglycerol-phosphate dehydratase
MMRQAELNRKTNETAIYVSLKLDGEGKSSASTSIGFLDHMMDLLARHARMDLEVRAEGDLHVDGHHTTEDIGIVLGKTLAAALGDKKGVSRYGSATVPMDEALASVSLDLSGRPYLVFSAQFGGNTVGDFATELTEEFFRALAFNAGMTLHISCPYGQNDHHKIEAIFKAFARALKEAAAIDPSLAGAVLSTKGTLS